MLDGSHFLRARAATARTSVLVVLFLAVVAWTLSTDPAAAYQSATSDAQNSTATTDALENHIDIEPGTALQPGSPNLVSAGLDLTFAIDLGRVPDARTFTDAFRITNTDTVAHQIRVSTVGAGLGAISAVAFTNDSNPGDGIDQDLIAPGATELIEVTTSTLFAGHQTGFLSFTKVGEERFYRRDLPIQIRQAPGAPSGLTATPSVAPSQIDLAWSAPATTGVSGYNVYRATAAGGPYSTINPSIVAGTAFTDTTASPGTTYWYRVRAIANGVTPELESVDSNTVSGQIAPPAPTPVSVAVPAGANNPVGYINSATVAASTVSVVVPAAALAGDIVNVELTDGTLTIGATQAVAVNGAQTVNLTSINASSMAQGSITLTAWITRGAGNGSTVAGAATQDTLATASAARVDATASNPVNFINIATGVAPGTATGAIDLPASSMATDTLSFRLRMGASIVAGTAAGLAGAGTRSFPGLSTNSWAQGAVIVEYRVQDVAGNDSGWIAGTPATRDTVAPATAPTAARIQATAINPIDTINIANQAAAPVTVTIGAGMSGAEARLTVAGVPVYGITMATGTFVVPVNATTLADAVAGGVQVAARQFDLAGNPSAWFIGAAARKDTIVPNNPNFTRITFTNRARGGRSDRVTGANGALGSRDEVRIHDYADGVNYPAAGYDAANNQGGFGRNDIANGTVPRTLGYDVRDSAWNPIARICRYYTANGTGSAIACP